MHQRLLHVKLHDFYIFWPIVCLVTIVLPYNRSSFPPSIISIISSSIAVTSPLASGITVAAAGPPQASPQLVGGQPTKLTVVHAAQQQQQTTPERHAAAVTLKPQAGSGKRICTEIRDKSGIVLVRKNITSSAITFTFPEKVKTGLI